MLKDAECFTHIHLLPQNLAVSFSFAVIKKDRIKVLIFDGDGWLLCYKRLTGDCPYQ